MGITHKKISTIPSTGDSSLVLPSDWNDQHVVSGTLDLTGATSVFGVVATFNGVPGGTCNPSQLAVNTQNGNFYSCSAGTWILVSGGGGGGNVTSAPQFALSYYSAAGTSNVLSGAVSPTSPNGVPQFFVETPSGGAATAPTFLLAGIVPRVVSSTSDTILSTDRGNYVTYNNANPVGVNLPVAGGSGFGSNFVFGLKNLGAGLVTITPTTSSIDGNTTLALHQGDSCTIYSDNTNYFSRCAPTQLIAGSNITFTTSANGLTIAAAGGGGASWSALSNPSGNLTLSMGTNTSGFNYTSALASAFQWSNTTAATSSVSQSSPVINLSGQGWSGASPANTQEGVNFQYVIPNGANSLELATFTMNSASTNGNRGYSFDRPVYGPAAGSFNSGAPGSRSASFDQGGVSCGAGSRCVAMFAGGNIDSSSIDTDVSRISAGLVGIGTGAAGSFAGTLKLTGVQVAEAAAPSGIASVDILFADSTTHTPSYNANNNGTSSFSGAWICTNVTPVTVNANVATDQNIQACTIPAGTLNRVGRTLRIWTAALYTTPAANVSTINLKAKLCTVSGCGSGTVINLASITSSANPGSVTNNSINSSVYATTQTAGASAAFESHGNLVIDLGASPGLVDSTFSDSTTATVGTIDSTAQLFLQITGAFSSASASNSLTGRQLIAETIG